MISFKSKKFVVTMTCLFVAFALIEVWATTSMLLRMPDSLGFGAKLLPWVMYGAILLFSFMMSTWVAKHIKWWKLRAMIEALPADYMSMRIVEGSTVRIERGEGATTFEMEEAGTPRSMHYWVVGDFISVKAKTTETTIMADESFFGERETVNSQLVIYADPLKTIKRLRGALSSEPQ